MVNQDIEEARAKLAAWDTDKSESTVEEVYVKLNCTEEHVKTSKTLDFGWRTLEPQDAVALGEILAKAEVCVNLNMFVNEVGPKGAKALAKAMATMPKLVQIDLQQWQVEPEGAQYLADAIRAHPRLKSVKMYYCKLGWDGTEAIAKACAHHKTLTNLDLGDNGMDEAGARHIVAMLATNTSITRLDLSKNEGLVDKPEVKAWFEGEVAKITATRGTPLTLILENSPGQKWHPSDLPPAAVKEYY